MRPLIVAFAPVISFVSQPTYRRRAARLGIALAFVLLHSAWVMAQDEEPAAPEPKSWVLAYILVVMMVGLALSLICRMGNRRNDVRQELPAP